MHPHGHGVVGIPWAFDERQVHFVAGFIAERVGGEFTCSGLDGAGAHFFDQRLGAAAVFDQVGNGADLQVVLRGKNLQVWQAGHGSVFVHHFANDGRRAAARHGGQVAARFGVARAHQHSAVHRLQREDMAGLHQVLRGGVRGYGGLHRARTVCRRNAGGNPFGRFDRHGERGGVLGVVARHHGRQLQAFTHLARQREADQPACVAGHEVDGFGRDMVGRENQVAFVFAVFFVHQDDHAASAHVGNNVFHRGDCNGVQGRGGHTVVMRREGNGVAAGRRAAYVRRTARSGRFRG